MHVCKHLDGIIYLGTLDFQGHAKTHSKYFTMRFCMGLIKSKRQNKFPNFLFQYGQLSHICVRKTLEGINYLGTLDFQGHAETHSKFFTMRFCMAQIKSNRQKNFLIFLS